MTRISKFHYFCAVLALSAVSLLGQTLGSVHGTVLDPSGAAVPNASVSLTGANGEVKIAQTDSAGTYTINGLTPGKYAARISAPGFGLLERKDMDLSSGRPVTMDAHLTIASETQEVTVTDVQHVELDPAQNASALVLKEGDLDMLPDDPDDLEADLLALAGPAAGPNGGQMYIDGFSNGQLPPKESIREIRINSNPFSSEYDAPGYGRVEILTKPGSDKIRGALQLNYGNSLFDARNPYSPEKPYYDTKNITANLGGPIIKNKMSYFLDFGRRDLRDSDLINAQLVPGTNYATSVIAPSTRTNLSPRVDYQLNSKITLQGRYSWVRQTQDNQGIGGTNLPSGVTLPASVFTPSNTSTAYSQTSNNQTFQLTETQVVNSTTINETRFQYSRQRQNQLGANPILNVQVNSAFSIGSNFPSQYTNQDNFELQNYTSIVHGPQFIKFGARIREAADASYYTTNFTGQYVFDSLAAYQAGTPTQYIIAGGNPLQDAKRFDAGLFVQDDWKVKPSITLSLGARYELQQNISDYSNIAPRIGLAWGIGPGQGRLRTPKTVIRAGYGWFYTRFPINSTLQSERDNGVNQLQYIVRNPCFFPNAPTIATLAGYSCPGASTASSLNIYEVDSNYRAGSLMQSAIGFDRQLPKNMTLSMNYINSRGVHQARTVNINTPLPGTYSLTNPSSAVYPYFATNGTGVVDLFESTGTFRQNQLIANVNARVNAKITLFGFYVFSHANSDVLGGGGQGGRGGDGGGGGGNQGGVGGQPSNPYNFANDYGRASFDIHHRVMINGTISAPYGVRLSPNITMNSAPPFNVTSGVDQYGSAQFNGRPAFLPAGFTAPACTTAIANAGTSCIVNTASFGSLVINPKPGMTVIPVNYGNGFGQFNVNMRISRSWGFGEKTTSSAAASGGTRGARTGGGFGPGIPGGGRPGGFGGGDTSGNKYTLTLGLYARNILNTVNPGNPEGNLLSPRFDQSTSLANAGFGATQSANRRMEFSLRLGF
jgi:Carboxypeptidase regulatory-like domain/TonB dependent receptor